MSYEQMIKNIKREAMSLSNQELNDKILRWKLNPELNIYVSALEEEYKRRNNDNTI